MHTLTFSGTSLHQFLMLPMGYDTSDANAQTGMSGIRILHLDMSWLQAKPGTSSWS